MYEEENVKSLNSPKNKYAIQYTPYLNTSLIVKPIAQREFDTSFFNRIQDPFIKLIDHFEVINIPTLSNISYE